MHDLSKNKVLMQLFVDGPTWDGNLISKADRNELLRWNLCNTINGWNYLTGSGVTAAVKVGMKAKDWSDGRYYRKAATLG